MNLTENQKHHLNRLYDYRNDISRSMYHIERILKDYFPDQYSLAYQHWIPQIITALEHDSRWLDRGVYTMRNTLDKISEKDEPVRGIKKVI